MLPFHRFRTADGAQVDSVLGPEMKSTGEVMGLDATFGTAFAKSQAAAYGSLPTKGTVFVSVANRDKRAAIFPVKRLADLGFRVLATAGTAQVLRRNGVDAEVVGKFSDGPGNVVERILAGEVDIVREHAVRIARQQRPAAGRLRDPHRRGGSRHPVPHHRAGRRGRGAGHRGAAPRRASACASLQDLHAAARRRGARVPADERGGRRRPVQENGEIFACSRSATTSQFTVVARDRRAAPARASSSRSPSAAPNSAMLLRRAFALYGATPGGEFAGTIQFVVAAHGAGHRAGWSSAAPGDIARRRRPARPAVPAARAAGRRPCWSAAATAAAPLIPLAAALLAPARRSRSSSARPRADRLFGELSPSGWSARSPSPPTTAAAGQRGLVTDALPDGDRAASAPRSSTPAGRWRCCARSATSRRAHAHPRPGRGRGVDGLRHRGVHDLRAAGARRGRPLPVRPLLRRGAGVRRRPGALGRRRHAAGRPRRRRRDGRRH